MIVEALRAKWRDRGPLGFALDALELAVAMPLVAVDLLTRKRPGARTHRCDADCAAGRAECGEVDR